MIYYGCPKCGAAMSSPDSMAGEFETCLECGNIAAVPAQPPPQPAPQLGAPTTVQVKPQPRKSDSPLGITSVVLGIFALLGSCTPRISGLSILLAAIGFICGALGLLYALVRRKSATRYPVAGVVVCIIVILISINTLTSGTVSSTLPLPPPRRPRPARPAAKSYRRQDLDYLYIGDKIVLRWRSKHFQGKKIMATTDWATYDAFLNACYAQDDTAKEKLLASGRIYHIEQGTPAIILDRERDDQIGLCRKVRLLSGIYADKEVWVEIEVTR